MVSSRHIVSCGGNSVNQLFIPTVNFGGRLQRSTPVDHEPPELDPLNSRPPLELAAGTDRQRSRSCSGARSSDPYTPNCALHLEASSLEPRAQKWRASSAWACTGCAGGVRPILLAQARPHDGSRMARTEGEQQRVLARERRVGPSVRTSLQLLSRSLSGHPQSAAALCSVAAHKSSRLLPSPACARRRRYGRTMSAAVGALAARCASATAGHRALACVSAGRGNSARGVAPEEAAMTGGARAGAVSSRGLRLSLSPPGRPLGGIRVVASPCQPLFGGRASIA